MASPEKRAPAVAADSQPPFARVETDSSQISSGLPSEAETSDSESSTQPTELRKMRRELEREKHRNSQLQAQVKRQTQLQGQLQLQAEQEEEYITNKLMKRLETLKSEKEELARQVEVEEEMITNALTKKLQKVKEEKIHLENQLEQEQEYIVNKLHKQLSQVTDEKRALEKKFGDDTGAILTLIQQHLARWTNSAASPTKADPKDGGPSLAPVATGANVGGSAGRSLPAPAALASSPIVAHSIAPPVGISDPPSGPLPSPLDVLPPLTTSTTGGLGGHLIGLPSALRGAGASSTIEDEGSADEWQRTHLLVSHLTREIDQLGEEHERFKQECDDQRKGNDKLRTELSRLQHENAGLCHRVTREREIRAQAIVDKARLENSLELDSERVFNVHGSNRSSVTSSPALSSSITSLPPSWSLPSPRGTTPSLLTPSVISANSIITSQQLSPVRAPSPKLPTTPNRDGASTDGGTPNRSRRDSLPGTPLSPRHEPALRDAPRAGSNSM